jgi:hypothetical protein
MTSLRALLRRPRRIFKRKTYALDLQKVDGEPNKENDNESNEEPRRQGDRS